MRRLALCKGASFVGEQVVVATPESVVRSTVMSPALLPRGAPPQLSTVVRYVEGMGASGSPVFDARKKCLLGLITRQFKVAKAVAGAAKPGVKRKILARYFIPAAQIAAFIPESVRH